MAEGSQERTNRRNVGRADVRRHGELFINPSSRGISDRTRSRVTVRATNIRLCLLVCQYPLKFHMLMEKNS